MKFILASRQIENTKKSVTIVTSVHIEDQIRSTSDILEIEGVLL